MRRRATVQSPTDPLVAVGWSVGHIRVMRWNAHAAPASAAPRRASPAWAGSSAVAVSGCTSYELSSSVSCCSSTTGGVVKMLMLGAPIGDARANTYM